MSKKRKLKKEGKYKESAGLYTGEFKSAKWTDELGERSWNEIPFANRSIERINGDKTVYKKTKNPKPYDITHIKKKTTQSGGWGFGIDGKEKIVEGKMKRKYDDEGNITKEKFRASNKEDRKMFRKIKKNKRKGITK